MSHAPLDGLDRVLDVAHETAASVDRDARFPQETVDALADAGLLGLTVPTSAGGTGGGPAEFLQTTRALAARCASSAMIYLMHVCAAQVTLAGTPSGDSEALRGLASGERLGTLAFSERGSRSHFWAPVEPDRRREDHRAEVVRHERRPREDVRRLDPSRGDGGAVRIQPVPGGRRRLRHRRRSGVGRLGPARQRERADDVRHAGRRRQSCSARREGPGPHARRGAAVVPTGSGRRVARDRRGRAPGGRRARDRREARAPGTDARRPPHGPRTDRARADRGRRDRRVPVGPRPSDGRGRRRPRPCLSAKAAANEMAIRVTSEIMQACGGAALSPALPMRAVLPRRARRVRDGADHRRPLRADGPGARRHAVAVGGDRAMTQELMVGAVAYDQKVVPIWEGIREYFRGAPGRDGFRAVPRTTRRR